ncbi:MAG: ankyrin repeat domain-containing protein [Clostridia bacterium]|nr:ankyrin repeat domain-containing protein [Clostridia bacterium]
MAQSKKYSKKKHLPLKITSEETWAELHRKQVRTYNNTSANWKQNFVAKPKEEQIRLMFKYALDGNKKMLKFIYQNCDIDFNITDADGNTPLMFAVKSGSREAVEYVLNNGANVNYLNNLGITPLHLATRKNSQTLVRVLLEFGAFVDIEDAYMQTPIFDAVQENNAEMIKYLFANGASINHQNKDGKTPLMVASFNRHRQEAMCQLLRLGAEVNTTDKTGRTAFMHAINNNNGAMMDILLKAGATINICDQDGYTPIMLCAKRGNREGLRVLIARGGDIFAKNDFGQTAYDIARACNNTTCAEILAKAERIYKSGATPEQIKAQLAVFATQNRMNNSCIR